MTRSFIILTLLVSVSAAERYLVSEPSPPQPQQSVRTRHDGGLKAPQTVVKLPRTR